MTTLHRIALLGFSAFECETLASCFRLASTREPRYELVQLMLGADFVVADADHPPSVELVLAVERLPETVFVGAEPPEGAVAWLQRPIDPLRVLRELDALASRRMQSTLPARAAALARRRGAEAEARRRTVIQPVRPERPEPPEHLLQQQQEHRDGGAGVDLPLPLEHLPPSAQPASSTPAAHLAPAVVRHASAATGPTALLVDDSEVALRFLQKKLAPFGLVADCVRHSDAAIERLAQRRYDFIFLDMELGDRSALDGLGLCRRIKRSASGANVVMVTAHHSELDRVRGALAGCDGFLGKPLAEDELALYLARCGVHAPVAASAALS
ncbi:MAG: response regulator [Rubrivivax sp.]